MNKKTINLIFQRFQEHNPDPVTELKYTNDYTLLVAVVLSAQATDNSVNKATEKLFKLVNTPSGMIEYGYDNLLNDIKSIGLYKQKAKNIMSLSQQLIELYDSKVPVDRDLLMNLPGVGRKTANVVLNVLANLPTMPVDTHVFRVSKRLGLAKSDNIIKVEEELIQNIPKEFLPKAHHWLVLHGRYVCKAKKPKCEKCFLFDLCENKPKL